jgi:hypothetical protein
MHSLVQPLALLGARYRKNDGFASLKQLEAKYGPLPETHMVRTQSGGVHYYWKIS